MTESQWTSLVGWMCRLWPHAPIEPSTAGAWWPFVAHLEHEQAKAAIAACALEPGRRFPPSPGDIVAAADPSGTDWFDAWLEVHDACKGASGRCRTESTDPAVVEFVGQLSEWRQDVDEGSSTLRAQFRDFYRTRTSQSRQRAQLELAASVVARLDGSQLRQIGSGDAA